MKPQDKQKAAMMDVYNKLKDLSDTISDVTMQVPDWYDTMRQFDLGGAINMMRLQGDLHLLRARVFELMAPAAAGAALGQEEGN